MAFQSGSKHAPCEPSGKPLRASRTVLCAVAAAVLGAGALGWMLVTGTGASATTSDAAKDEWLQVKRADFPVVVIEDGELRPVKVTTLGFTFHGKVAWIVAEGTRVKQGDRVIALETDELEEQIQQIQEELTVAERDLAQKTQTRDLDKQRIETEQLAEKDRLELAKLKAREILDKPSELDQQEARNIQEGAQARLDAARADWEALQPLVERGFANRAEVEAKELALRLAEKEMEKAALRARDILDGADAHERRSAGLDLRIAEMVYQTKVLDAQSTLRNNDSLVLRAEHNVANLKKRLEDREQNLSESARSAPHDGIVVYRNIGWREVKKVAVGERISPWSNPIDLPLYEQMKVRTQVPESAVRKLKARRQGPGGTAEPGSPASVRIKTLPGKVYPAEVIWIDGWARDRNANLSDADIKNKGMSGVRVFDVEVELKEGDPQRLRDGFQATVEFPIETIPSAIAVPSRAVTIRNGRPTVIVGENGDRGVRAVSLGVESNGFVVVQEGLEEGERVLVPPKPPEQAEPLAVRKKDESSGPPGGGGAGSSTGSSNSSSSSPPSSSGSSSNGNGGEAGSRKGGREGGGRGSGGSRSDRGGGGRSGRSR